MAKAEKTTVEKVVTEDGTVLTLNEAETRAVYAALLRVGGDPTESPRGLIDGVRDAIDKRYGRAGWNWRAYDPEWACFQDGPGLIAKNYDSDAVKARLASRTDRD